MKKVVILTEFFSTSLNKNVVVDEIFEADEDQLERFDEVGIKYEDFVEDGKSGNDDLIEAFKNDKSTVDSLKADDLKVICETFEVEYESVAKAKEALKALEV